MVLGVGGVEVGPRRELPLNDVVVVPCERSCSGDFVVVVRVDIYSSEGSSNTLFYLGGCGICKEFKILLGLLIKFRQIIAW